MRRREFIGLMGGAAAFPLAARAQQQTIRRVGLLIGGAQNDGDVQSWVGSFQRGLQDLGWGGRNLRFIQRWNGGISANSAPLAGELVALAPDAILATSPQVLSPLLSATRTIPIVFVNVSVPIGA